MTRTIPFTLLLAVCFGCQAPARPDPAPPSNEEATLIAVRIYAHEQVDKHYPASIAFRGAYFVRVAEGADPTRTTPVIPSNYYRGNVAYLLNAEPGRYAVVAFDDEAEGVKRPTYLSAEAIRATLVDVGPGERAMMGTLRVVQSSLLSKSDESQRFYRDRVFPPDQRSTGAFSYFRGPREFRSLKFTINREQGTLDSMRKVLRQHLGELGW